MNQTQQPTFNVINGNSAEVLKTYPDNHFDAVVTDPPYGISFLGKDWDKDTGEEEVYRQCLRVLKPGGHLLAFSAARTYHHLAMAVERAGFEIRDQIMWVYGSGFPKSQDIGRAIDRREGKGKFTPTGATQMSGGLKEFPDGPLPRSEKLLHTPETDEAKQWSGWGTNLKPAHEPIVMARKPVEKSIIDNVQKWGVGAINVDACRVEHNEVIPDNLPSRAWANSDGLNYAESGHDHNSGTNKEAIEKLQQLGRFPANFIHDGSDEVVTMFPNDCQRFFYVPKVGRKERNTGCEDITPQLQEAAHFRPNQLEKALNGEDGNPYGRYTPTNNNHPTVKPVELMRYLIKLVTPPNSHILDPFNGSGSTGMAAVELGHQYTGIEMDPKYCEIAKKRIEAWYDKCNPKPFNNDLFRQQ